MTLLSTNIDFISFDGLTSVLVVSRTNFHVNFGLDATLLKLVLKKLNEIKIFKNILFSLSYRFHLQYKYYNI